MATKGKTKPRSNTPRLNLWSAPAKRSGDDAFPRLWNTRLVLHSSPCKSLVHNEHFCQSCQIVPNRRGWDGHPGER